MALPQNKIILNVNPDDLTIGDLVLFESGGFTVIGFRNFLNKYSGWRAKEIDKITRLEMSALFADIIRQLNEAASPKVNAPS